MERKTKMSLPKNAATFIEMKPYTEHSAHRIALCVKNNCWIHFFVFTAFDGKVEPITQ